MSTLTTHTTANRDSHSVGLCKFNTTDKSIEVSDGTNWAVYNYDFISFPTDSNKYAVSLDGINDYVAVGNYSDYNFTSGGNDTAFSITAWINMTDATDFIVASKDEGSNRQFNIRFVSDKIHFYLLGGGYIGRRYDTTVTSDEGSWIHVGFTYDGSKSDTGIKIYRNGTRVDDANYSGGTYNGQSATTAPFNIGRSGNTYAEGKIDEVGIFGSELSASNISSIYNNGSPGDLSGFNPIGWWRMGDKVTGTGTTILDQGSGSHNGTLTNGASFYDLSTTPDSIYVA